METSLSRLGFVLFNVLLTVTAYGQAAQSLTVAQLVEGMRKAEAARGSFTGTETVTIDHIATPKPDLSRNVIAKLMPEGEYRWYVHGPNWWMIKTLRNRTDGKYTMTRYLLRDYQGKVLNATYFDGADGKRYFASASIDGTQYQAYLGPMAGRMWTVGPISDILLQMTDVRQTRSEQGIEVDGLFQRQPVHLTISPEHGYLTTRYVAHPKNGRFGFTINKVRQLGDDWMPEDMDIESGKVEDGRIVKGSTGHVHFAEFEPHAVPTKDEAPGLPPGAILGSDDSRLLRVAQDGSSVDFGRKGERPGTSLAYGDLFVLSGAGLLLTSLSWLVFRKRRTAGRAKGAR